MKRLHITLAQINPIVGNLDYNAQKILKIWEAEKNKTDLIIFPEMALCGYPPEDLILKPSFLKAIKTTINKICKETKSYKAAALIPAPWLIRKKIQNAFLLIEGGKITAKGAKRHLPNYGVFDEQRLFKPGGPPKPIEFRGTKLGVMLCEDMWHPDIAAALKKKGAEILIAPNASPFDVHKHEKRVAEAKKRIAETTLPLIYVNQTGGQDELVFDGASFALNETGQPLLKLSAFEEDSGHIIFEKQDGGQWFASTSESAEEFNEEESIYQALMTGLRDYISKNGFPGILIGLSGGIDSALSAAIAVDALGTDMVHPYFLPSKYTSKESLEDAAALAKNLGLEIRDISIEKPVAVFEDIMAPHFTNETPGLTHENIQSRTRGLMLMALSNATGYMALSTGNKSEMAVGYATLYGDMCGGFNVLKDLYKTQVYKLSEWRNKNKPLGGLGPTGPAIPSRSITKAPTAELRENQTDQDSLPPYDILDAILHAAIEEEESAAEIIALGHDKTTVRKVLTMIDRAEYKRRQAPPGVKITARAFGRERRYPITNHFMNFIEK